MADRLTYAINFMVRMDKEMHKRVSFVSKECGVTMAEYVRGLLTRHMEEDSRAVAAIRKMIQDTPAEA